MSLPLRVRDYMTKDVLTVTPQTEITQAVQLMIDRDISGVLVVDASGALVGIVTERDCIAVAAAAGYYDDWGGPVEDFMSASVETVAPDDNLADVATRMTSSPHRRFPVMDAGRLVGLISRRDVLRAMGSGSWFAKADRTTRDRGDRP
jgi:CBS domain-containing protein